MRQREHYCKRNRIPILVIALLYLGLGILLYYDLSFSKTPITVLENSIKYEKEHDVANS